MKRLTRKEIKEGLEAIPIETVLLGTVSAKDVTLTAKQKEFARQIALGESKASAYRKSRNSKAKPSTASKRGGELAKRGDIQGQIEAYKVAMEAQRFATPAHLRALTIHELTKGALDPDMPPAQRVKCLELLGKITEVALFTERREVVQVKDAEQIKAKLLESIRMAIRSDAVDVESTGDDLLAELVNAKDEGANATNTEAIRHEDSVEDIECLATPQKQFDTPTALTHSIPHTRLSDESAHLPTEQEPTDLTCSPCTGDNPNKINELESK